MRRLLTALLLVLLGLVGASTTTASAAACTYDAPTITRVDVQTSEVRGVESRQVTGSREGSASRPSPASDPCSTPSATFVATNTAPFGEIGPAGNPGLLPTQQHHVFPQKYRSTFENAGVAIDDFTVPLNRTQHLKGVHGSGLPGQGLPGRWNQRWGEWLDANPGAGAKEIFQQGGQMMDDFGLGGLPIGPYKGVR